MPFDGAAHAPRHNPPSRATRNKDTLVIVMLIVALCLFLVPILIAVLVDNTPSIRAHQAACSHCGHATAVSAAAQSGR